MSNEREVRRLLHELESKRDTAKLVKRVLWGYSVLTTGTAVFFVFGAHNLGRTFWYYAWVPGLLFVIEMCALIGGALAFAGMIVDGTTPWDDVKRAEREYQDHIVDNSDVN